MLSERPADIRRAVAWLALASLAGLAAPQLARAQSGSGTLSQFRQGYNGAGLSSLEGAVNVSTRDANGNLVITDGVTQVGSDQSMFSRSGSTSGASDSYSGAGAVGGASAIGNNLSVNVLGNYNTVVVNSTQVNNGDVSATTVLNGKVNLDGGQ